MRHDRAASRTFKLADCSSTPLLERFDFLVLHDALLMHFCRGPSYILLGIHPLDSLIYIEIGVREHVERLLVRAMIGLDETTAREYTLSLAQRD